jgi:peptidoglycan hydrolase CwlO-like protein
MSGQVVPASPEVSNLQKQVAQLSSDLQACSTSSELLNEEVKQRESELHNLKQLLQKQEAVIAVSRSICCILFSFSFHF